MILTLISGRSSFLEKFSRQYPCWPWNFLPEPLFSGPQVQQSSKKTIKKPVFEMETGMEPLLLFNI